MRSVKAPARFALAVLAFAICCLRGFVLPHTPVLFWGDAPGFATRGARILNGEMPYRDFFEFLTPGTDLVYAALFRCFGILPWLPNLAMAFLAALTAWLMTYCAAQLVRGWLVALPALLLIGLVLCGSMDATHHWYSTLLIMAAAAVLLKGSSRMRIGSAAILIGTATSFTQTKGFASAVGLALFLLWRSAREGHGKALLWRRAGMFLGVAGITFLAINLPFVLAAGPARWLSQVFIFPVRYFGSVSANNLRGTWPEFRTHHGVLKWVCFPFLYIGLPLIYSRFFLRMVRRGKSEPDQPWDGLLLIAIVGVAMLAVMVPALSIRRISCVSPPAMILLAWQLSGPGQLRRPVSIALGTVSCLVALAQIAAVQLRPHVTISLFRGTYALPDPANYQLYRWTADHTRPGQWYFGFPMLDLPLGLRNPTPLEAFGPNEYSRPEQVAQTIAALERTRTPLLILHESIVAPKSRGYTTDHLQPFRDYLHGHYRQVNLFYGGFEAWQRIDP
jgi:hypothetical protein